MRSLEWGLPEFLAQICETCVSWALIPKLVRPGLSFGFVRYYRVYETVSSRGLERVGIRKYRYVKEEEGTKEL